MSYYWASENSVRDIAEELYELADRRLPGTRLLGTVTAEEICKLMRAVLPLLECDSEDE